MENPIKSIVAFNKKAGLLDNGYNDFLEASCLIEEAFEGFDHLGNYSAKDRARLLMEDANFLGTNVDRLDKACDATVFAIGSMAKLGLNAQEITKALNIVMKANNQKLGMPKDEYGKLQKPDNFNPPEPQLQLLLDEVKSRQQ